MSRIARAPLLLLLVGCQSTAPLSPQSDSDLEDLRATLAELYRAFCFDPGAEPDWALQRELYLEGASFVAPIASGRRPIGADTETFLDDFRAFVRSGPYAETGLHERVLRMDVAACGDIAHAFVLFEGHLPGRDEAETRGLDSLQLVRDAEAWRVVSFTTQYEREGAPLTLRRRTYP